MCYGPKRDLYCTLLAKYIEPETFVLQVSQLPKCNRPVLKIGVTSWGSGVKGEGFLSFEGVWGSYKTHTIICRFGVGYMDSPS
jgi:hypothetical protein